MERRCKSTGKAFSFCGFWKMAQTLLTHPKTLEWDMGACNGSVAGKARRYHHLQVHQI